MSFQPHVVSQGDTLWGLAGVYFGDPSKWPQIATDNHVGNDARIFVGQTLRIRSDLIAKSDFAESARSGHLPGAGKEHQASVVPARGFLFVLADEIDPFRQKYVRKVMVSAPMSDAFFARTGTRLAPLKSPELFGLHPTDPHSKVSMGRHALGMKPSPYSSASHLPFGASRFTGSRFWIDAQKAEMAGASFHQTEAIAEDLDRIAKKMKKPADLARVDAIKQLVKADGEVLVKGAVPASAVKGAASMGLTRGLQGVQIIGFAVSAYDVSAAAHKSVQQHSVKPIAAEGVRQVGGWASAWAGAKLGAAGGALLGIETGPGAIVTGAIGGIAGGVAGYFAFDWIADHIDPN